MYNALSTNDQVIYNEVLLSINRLIKKYGQELKIEWDILMMIMLKLNTIQLPPSSPRGTNNESSGSYKIAYSETICLIGELIRKDCYYGDKKEVNNLLEMFIPIQTEHVVFLLITDRMEKCVPYNDEWKVNTQTLLKIYLLGDDRASIQQKVINELIRIFMSYKGLYEEEMISHMISLFSHHTTLSSASRKMVSELFVEVASVCSRKHFGGILDMMNELYQPEPLLVQQEVKSQALIQLFNRRFNYVEGSTLPTIYNALLQILKLENRENIILPVYSLLFRMTANKCYKIVMDKYAFDRQSVAFYEKRRRSRDPYGRAGEMCGESLYDIVSSFYHNLGRNQIYFN